MARRKKRDVLFPGISGVTPEGGHQDPEVHAGAYRRLYLPHEPARCMFPAELVEIIYRNLNPRFTTGGIQATRFGAQPRKDAGLDAHGTTWFANEIEREWSLAIPCDCIPYTTIKTATWDEDRMRWVQGEVKRGWRSLLEQLTEYGFLKPTPEIAWYVGKDMRRQTPKQYGGWLSDAHYESDDSPEAFKRLIAPYIDTPGVTAYGNDEIAELAVANYKGGYRGIEKEVKHYA